MAFRQALANQARTAVEHAIARHDQTYGRQLATMVERSALELRAAFGRATPLHGRRPGAVGNAAAPKFIAGEQYGTCLGGCGLVVLANTEGRCTACSAE